MTMNQIKQKAFHLKSAGVVVFEMIDDYGIEVSCMVNGVKRVLGLISAEDKIKEMHVICNRTIVSPTGKVAVVCTDVYNNMFKTVTQRVEKENNHLTR